jgi:hypothetical protein
LKFDVEEVLVRRSLALPLHHLKRQSSMCVASSPEVKPCITVNRLSQRNWRLSIGGLQPSVNYNSHDCDCRRNDFRQPHWRRHFWARSEVKYAKVLEKRRRAPLGLVPLGVVQPSQTPYHNPKAVNRRSKYSNHRQVHLGL